MMMIKKGKSEKCINRPRRKIFFGLALLFSLLFSYFGCSLSVFAYNPSVYNPFYFESINASDYSYATPSVAIGTWKSGIENYNSYSVKNLGFKFVPQSSFQAMSFQGSFKLGIYFWNGPNIELRSGFCENLFIVITAFEGLINGNNSSIPPTTDDVQVTYCGQPANNSWYIVEFSYSFVTDNVYSFDFFEFILSSNTYEGDDAILGCSNYPMSSLPYCYPNSNIYWGVGSFSVEGLEPSTDSATAIALQQLILQRRQWEQEQRDRQDAEQGVQSGNQQVDGATSQLNTTVSNFLSVITSLYSALVNVHPTNCLVDFGSVSFPSGGGFSFGRSLDFCSSFLCLNL